MIVVVQHEKKRKEKCTKERLKENKKIDEDDGKYKKTMLMKKSGKNEVLGTLTLCLS